MIWQLPQTRNVEGLNQLLLPTILGAFYKIDQPFQCRDAIPRFASLAQFGCFATPTWRALSEREDGKLEGIDDTNRRVRFLDAFFARHHIVTSFLDLSVASPNRRWAARESDRRFAKRPSWLFSGAQPTPTKSRHLLGSALFLALLSNPISGQAGTPESTSGSCEAHTFRYDDDCRGLASSVETLQGIDRLKYLPLDSDGKVWLTIGGEYRLKTEALDAPDFGVVSADKAYVAVGERFLAHADVRTQTGWRLFLQFSAATDVGRRPVERSFDRSAPDIAQGFVEIPVEIPKGTAALRIGRQELDLGDTRLVSPREVANLRLAFDMASALVHLDDADVLGFWGRPVVNKSGAFDDSAPTTESFYGITIKTRPTIVGSPVEVDTLLLGRNRAHASFFDATGPEQRRFAGVRIAGVRGAVDYSAAISYEFGHVGQSDISAYGISATGGYRFETARWKPRFGVDFGLASGDRNRRDGKINSFDPLYPNLGYFTDAPVDFPVNWIGIEPNISIEPQASISIKFGTDIHFRDSTADGIYASSGKVFVPGGLSDGSFADALAFAHMTWHATHRLQLDLGYVRGWVGKVVSTVHGHDLNYGVVAGLYRF